MNKVFINDKPLYLTIKGPDHPHKRSIAYTGRSSIIEALEYLCNANSEGLYITHQDINVLRQSFLKDLKYIEAAGGIVKNTQNELLFILRHGKWDLPKGKAESGEKSEETAIREVQEECGISSLKIIKPLPNTYHAYKLKGEWALKCTQWYFMEYTGTEKPIPQTEEDITEVRWFSVDELFTPFSNTYKSISDLILTGFINIS